MVPRKQYVKRQLVCVIIAYHSESISATSPCCPECVTFVAVEIIAVAR